MLCLKGGCAPAPRGEGLSLILQHSQPHVGELSELKCWGTESCRLGASYVCACSLTPCSALLGAGKRFSSVNITQKVLKHSKSIP